MDLDDIMKDFDEFGEEEITIDAAPEVPEYSDMGGTKEMPDTLKVELRKRAFNEITEFTREPTPIFDDPLYYKTVLKDEGQVSVRLHETLSKMVKSTDSTEKQELRARVIPLYWELHTQLTIKAIDADSPLPKRLAARYGAVLPNFISKEHRSVLSQIILENNTGEAVWYSDEWVAMVAEGKVNRLATDEEVSTRTGDVASEIAKIRSKLDKLSGSKEAMAGFMQNLERERQEVMGQFKECTQKILEQHSSHRLADVHLPFDAEQKQALSQLNNIMKSSSSLIKNIEINYNKYLELLGDIDKCNTDLERLSNGGPVVDNSVAEKEARQIAVLAKICTGRRGNHYPLLSSQFFMAKIASIATRENVIAMMDEIEKIDVAIFQREFRRQINRIPPHVIIIPCYGNNGTCWEPYERNNKATSRGRIAVPMFPGDLRSAVITALGDLRWQAAKEMAAHYWMEEGLTGSFFQWFTAQKMRGDVRATFVENYLLWIAKESEGMQKLDREVRGIFWRNMPFSIDRREKLKDRGFVYNQLYINDQNRPGAFDPVYPD
jgi:hypothetical protein